MTFRIQGAVTLLQVFDMPTSLAFYRDGLGFRVVQQTPPGGDDFDWGLLERDGVQLMLNTAHEKPDRPPRMAPARRTAHGDTCLFVGCPDVDAAYAELSARGLAHEPPRGAPYGMKQLTLARPGRLRDLPAVASEGVSPPSDGSRAAVVPAGLAEPTASWRGAGGNRLRPDAFERLEVQLSSLPTLRMDSPRALNANRFSETPKNKEPSESIIPLPSSSTS